MLYLETPVWTRVYRGCCNVVLSGKSGSKWASKHEISRKNRGFVTMPGRPDEPRERPGGLARTCSGSNGWRLCGISIYLCPGPVRFVPVPFQNGPCRSYGARGWIPGFDHKHGAPSGAWSAWACGRRASRSMALAASIGTELETVLWAHDTINMSLLTELLFVRRPGNFPNIQKMR